MNIKYAIRQSITIVEIDSIQYVGTTSNKLTTAIHKHNLKYILANCKQIPPNNRMFKIDNFIAIDTKTIKHRPINLNN